MWHRSFLLSLISLLLIAVTLPAFALERPFPDNVHRGKMTQVAFPQVVIDGKVRRLSPGAQIRNRENTIEMPAGLRGDQLDVNYTENEQGEIHRVWILTPAEAARPLKERR